MLDLFSRELPDSVEVNGELYFIQTDYKFFILFNRLIQVEHRLEDFSFMFPFEKPADMQAGINEIMKFSNPPALLPRADGQETNLKIVDYDIDSDYIYAAFFEQYGIDLLDPSVDMHWYKFLALFRALHHTKLTDILEIRCYTPKPSNTDMNKERLRLRSQWELPQPEDSKEQEDLESFNKLFD